MKAARVDGEVVEYDEFGHVREAYRILIWQKWLREHIDLPDCVPYYHSSLGDDKARIAVLPMEELA